MKLSVLTDNFAGRKFLAEQGLSFYIEADIDVLFDTGQTDVFLINAQRLQLDLKPDVVVLSHGHHDHGNGLKYLPKNKLVCHPAAFTKRYSKEKEVNVGIDLSLEDAQVKFEIQMSVDSLRLSEQVWFLGQIPRKNDFESKNTFFKDQWGNDDFIDDDSALAINTDSGLVIVSGCAHAGICNTVEHAIKVTGVEKVDSVIGGFHLKTHGKLTIDTIDYFKKKGIKKLYPSHCTSLPALTLFYDYYSFQQVSTGNFYYF